MLVSNSSKTYWLEKEGGEEGGGGGGEGGEEERKGIGEKEVVNQ